MHPLVKLHGSKKPLPEGVRLRAGKIELIYDSGFLRYIKSGETEVIRMINHYIRDENWNTIPMTIIAEKVEPDAASFKIAYTAQCNQGDIQFQWNCQIEGKSDSTITFEIEGEALHTFKRNRLGFTVLHPIDSCSGNDCNIFHSDNTSEAVRFPESISPHQPFLDIVGMQWNPAEGIEAILNFEGDIFETEDQRNWTDASFKTYCTPLSKPFPATIKKGDIVRQKIRLSVSANVITPTEKQNRLTFFLDKENISSFPMVGLPLSSLSHDTQSWQRINDLNVDFLRITLSSHDTDIPLRIKPALDTNIPLELVLFFEKTFSEEFIQLLLPLRDRVKQIIVLPAYANCTDSDLIGRTVPLLRNTFPKSKIGGGTDAFFTELNRERTPPASLDFLSFSINPQAHAFDVATLTENLVTQAHVVRSCRDFADGRDIHVGPVTLKMRTNPNATSAGAKTRREPLPDDVDPRQISLYAAAWTLGSFKYLAENNVGAISFYETCGWKGLFPHTDQPWPAEFLFPEDAVYPVYVVLKAILGHKGSRVTKLVSNRPLVFDGLAFVDQDGKDTIMLANYTRDDQAIQLPPDFKVSMYWSLDGTNVADMILNPRSVKARSANTTGEVLLLPFSITVLN